MSSTTIHTIGEEQTVALGRRLGALAAPGDIFLLSGELGTGKTCLVRGIAAGLGASDWAASPSFVIIRQYRGRLTLYHMDFYRLEHPQEIADLGIEDYLYADGVCAVEWADRAGDLLPEEHLLITLSYTDREGQRDVVLTVEGHRYNEVVDALLQTSKDGCRWN